VDFGHVQEMHADAAGAAVRVGAIALSESLFESLPHTPFFVKDNALRFVRANSAMVDLCGAQSRTEVLGKTARDIFEEPVRARHEALDRHVMRTLKPLKDQLDLCVRKQGAPVWLMTGRWPLVADTGEVVGVAGIARILAAERRQPAYERLAVAIEYLHSNFGVRFDISEMARRAGVSSSQLKRDFISVFGVPPRRYLTKVRLEAALERLAAGGPIVEVAHACGYPDQSAFTRRFRAAVGMSPSEYRRTRPTVYAALSALQSL
jgi:PAS domain S-box-containing protein